MKNVSDIQGTFKEEQHTLERNIKDINRTSVQETMKIELESLRGQVRDLNRTLVNQQQSLMTHIQSIKKVLGDTCITCPPDWKLVGYTCYFFSSEPKTWSNARNECNMRSSALLIMKNIQELNALQSLTGNKKFWIGLKRDNTKNWKWVDGTLPTFTRWMANEPNNFEGREHCGEMVSGFWNDLDCNNVIDYICKGVPNC
ncbi:C-type lectin domain family 4 member G-like [Spea bombifrons]|uniref:C-type lectin domain family 4 member G-like n=1 Tax=Spea bombifrons TaxID=233779 RepID=UPI00234B94D3|nr:C-type lectin domain family 4 member G-like [Spea bombifrons]